MTEPKITQPFATLEQVQQTVPDPAREARTAAELRAAQAAEYGKFIAAQTIDIDGVRAFNPGHAVPVGMVSDAGPVYPGQVALRDQVEAAAVQRQQIPARNASAEEWRGYAIDNGVPEDEALTLGRDEIRSRFES